MQTNYLNDVANTLAEGCALFDVSVAAGTTAIAETPVGVIGPGTYQLALGAVTINPAAALAISGSAYITITLAKRTAGGAAVTIATFTTFTGGTALVAWTPAAMTLATGAGSFVSPGDVITMTIANTGTASMPALQFGGFVKVN